MWQISTDKDCLPPFLFHDFITGLGGQATRRMQLLRPFRDCWEHSGVSGFHIFQLLVFCVDHCFLLLFSCKWIKQWTKLQQIQNRLLNHYYKMITRLGTNISVAQLPFTNENIVNMAIYIFELPWQVINETIDLKELITDVWEMVIYIQDLREWSKFKFQLSEIRRNWQG